MKISISWAPVVAKILEMYSRGVDVVVESLGGHPPDGQPALTLPLVDVIGHHVTGEAKVSHLEKDNDVHI